LSPQEEQQQQESVPGPKIFSMCVSVVYSTRLVAGQLT